MMQSRVAGRRGARAHVDICNAIRPRRAPRIAGHAAADDPGCHLAKAEIGLTVPANPITTSLYPIAEVNQEAPLSQTSGTRSPSPLWPATEPHVAGAALRLSMASVRCLLTWRMQQRGHPQWPA